MDKARLALLRAEMSAQVRQIDEIYGKIAERKEGKGQADVESLAYQLHNLYCAFEDLFKRVAGTFENRLDEARRYHVELLKRLRLTIEGVRPALIRRSPADSLTRFGHFATSSGMPTLSSLIRERFASCWRMPGDYRTCSAPTWTSFCER